MDRHVNDAVRLLRWAYDELLATNNRQGALRVGLELSNALFLANSRHEAFEVLGQVMEWAAKAGAISFVLERPREFHQFLTTVHKEAFAAKSKQRAFLEQLMIKARSQDGTPSDPAGARGPKQALTQRERSIIEFIAGGQSNKQIAGALGVTPETVRDSREADLRQAVGRISRTGGGACPKPWFPAWYRSTLSRPASARNGFCGALPTSVR